MSTEDNIGDLTEGDNPTISTTYGHQGAQAIYNGTSIAPVSVTLLDGDRTYYFRIFPYSGNRTYDLSYSGEEATTTACAVTSTTENEVCFSRSNSTLTVTSNQLPTHSTGKFPNADVTATDLQAEITLSPSQQNDVTYLWDETGGPTPRNQNFWRFGVASNGLGFNPMGLKPYSNPDTGEENWAWQAKVTEEGETDLDNVGGHVTSQGMYHYHGDMTELASEEDGSR
ncbi:MAG TPA: hypothetical protein DCE41_17620, partial [Cytophagales bacterium]|nr:hypothetical protein [Cytophagales bacterium]